MIKRIITVIALLLAAIGAHAQYDAKTQAVIDNIMTRTSVRSFDTKPVEASKIETMLRCAMAAPTDRNLQPWHFVVLNTPEALAAYFGSGEERKATPQHAPKPAADGKVQAERKKKSPPTLVILICGDTTRMQQGVKRELWVQDLSAASENLLLAAHALGLGAVWITGYPTGKVDMFRKRLNLPNNLIPLNAIHIGYPDPSIKLEPKNKWDEKKITYGPWK